MDSSIFICFIQKNFIVADFVLLYEFVVMKKARDMVSRIIVVIRCLLKVDT